MLKDKKVGEESSEKVEPSNKNIVLILGAPAGLEDFKDKYKDTYRLFLVRGHKDQPLPSHKKYLSSGVLDGELLINFDSTQSIMDSLKSLKDEVVAVTCRKEAKIPELQKLIPYLPYLKTPTVASLEWCTNKVEMRRRLFLYDKKITPKYKVVTDTTKATIEKIRTEIGFPLVLKPSGLAQSTLVNIIFHEEELETTLKKVLKKIDKAYKEAGRKSVPQVLVEQFMEGDMYSIDAFVNSRGKIYFAPMVHVKTGRDIGFDDFFAYRTLTPTSLKKNSIEDAQVVATKAIRAVGLRSSTAHIEMYRTEDGWKIIELGPRLGGFRYDMYKLSYGLDATAADIFIRLPKKLSMPKKVRGYTAVFKFFAIKEGKLGALGGIKKIQGLKSFHSIAINKQVGDTARFAKNGGKSIFNITLFNEDRSKLFADIRRMEQTVKISIK